MQCCVPFCVNSTDNASTSERTGITFHELPSEESPHAAWLKALGKQDHNLSYPAVVCSQHFLDEDFVKAEGCVRQISSSAIPPTLQMCMMCLDTDGKLLLMSKHRLEEIYQQLTGLSLFQLCRGANLRPTLCVLCAQRLINFSRVRELSLKVHSLMMELLERYGLITTQHKELMNYTTKHLQCNLTQTTLAINHCDLYIDRTDEDEQTAAEDPAVTGFSTVVVKKEDTDSLSMADDSELIIGNDNVNAIFGCTRCFEDFVHEDDYNEHMRMHLQNAGGDAACGAAASCSWNTLVPDNKAGSQRLMDDPPPSADFFHGLVPLSTGLAVHNENKVQATVEAGVIQKSEKIFEANIGDLDNQSSENCTKPSRDINTFTNYVVKLNDVFKKPKLDKNLRVRTDTGSKSYSCDVCRYKTAKRSLFQYHIKTHEKSYTSEIQNYTCSQKGNLLRRIKTHTGKKPHTCEICNYKCLYKCNLLQHIKSHTGEKPYTCDTCNYKCAAKSTLLQHIKTHTGEKPHTCEICNYKSTRKANLLSHMTTHTGEKPYTCKTCNYKCAVKSTLSQHIKTHTGEKPHTCEICNYKCARKTTLKQHIKSHTGEKPYTCEICNYKSARKFTLVRHIRTHTGDKPYSCEICNYKCTLKNNLLEHIKTHTGVKPYTCVTCNYKCARKSTLKQHIRIHTGEKPYTCEACNYKCSSKCNLLQHIKSHTGEKPYNCETCNYKCAAKSTLLEHIRTHTGEKPHTCEMCNYKCARKSNLIKHLKTHTGEKPY